MERIRILLADSQSLFREAVRAVLEQEPDFVVATAGSANQAIAEAERTRPDIVLLDMGLPAASLDTMCAEIKKRSPNSGIVALAGHESQSTLIEALEAGANGYLVKDCPVSELIEVTRVVHRGETSIPHHMVGGLLDRLIGRGQQHGEALRRVSELTRREKEVLSLLADGGDNNRIAEALVISPETARTHIQKILAKLQVHSRLEAAVFVRQNRVLQDLISSR